MDDMPIDRTNLFDVFAERVQAAANGVPISDDVQLYITSVLLEWVRADRQTYEEDTFAELYILAEESDHVRKPAVFKELGDRALIMLGVFKPSISRKVVSESYYAEMGAAAYYRTHQWYYMAYGNTFKDLATQFDDCVAVVEHSMGL